MQKTSIMEANKKKEEIWPVSFQATGKGLSTPLPGKIRRAFFKSKLKCDRSLLFLWAQECLRKSSGTRGTTTSSLPLEEPKERRILGLTGSVATSNLHGKDRLETIKMRKRLEISGLSYYIQLWKSCSKKTLNDKKWTILCCRNQSRFLRALSAILVCLDHVLFSLRLIRKR